MRRPADRRGGRPRLAGRLRLLLIVPAVAAVAVVAVAMRLAPFALAMVDGDRPPPGGSHLAGAPYGDRGAHQVGTRAIAVGGGSLAGVLWYPALPAPGPEPVLTSSYELKLFAPVGRLAIATRRGRARRGAPYDRSSGPFPIVVLSPGFAIGSDAYAWLAEHLASHGLVVMALEHDEELDPAGLWRATVRRPRDIRAALAHLARHARPGGGLAGVVNRERVAVVGHSYGGYAALAAAGGRLDSDAFEARCDVELAGGGSGAWLCDALVPRLGAMAEVAGLEAVPSGLWPSLAAPGVDAVVSMAGDAYLFGRGGLAEITVPVMAIGGTGDSDTPYAWGTRPTYELTSGARRARAALRGAGHMIFTGPCERMRRIMSIAPGGFCSDPAWDRHRAQAIVRHLATAFLLAELRDDRAAAAALAPGGVRLPDLLYAARGYEAHRGA